MYNFIRETNLLLKLKVYGFNNKKKKISKNFVDKNI